MGTVEKQALRLRLPVGGALAGFLAFFLGKQIMPRLESYISVCLTVLLRLISRLFLTALQDGFYSKENLSDAMKAVLIDYEKQLSRKISM